MTKNIALESIGYDLRTHRAYYRRRYVDDESRVAEQGLAGWNGEIDSVSACVFDKSHRVPASPQWNSARP